MLLNIYSINDLRRNIIATQLHYINVITKVDLLGLMAMRDGPQCLSAQKHHSKPGFCNC